MHSRQWARNDKRALTCGAPAFYSRGSTLVRRGRQHDRARVPGHDRHKHRCYPRQRALWLEPTSKRSRSKLIVLRLPAASTRVYETQIRMESISIGLRPPAASTRVYKTLIRMESTSIGKTVARPTSATSASLVGLVRRMSFSIGCHSYFRIITVD